MSLVEFVGSNAEAPNEMTRVLCGSACSATTTAAAAVAVAKQHLLDEFVFVGLQECFPESEAILASKLPWTSHDGLAELRDNVAPKTRTTITHHERKEILTHNAWDFEVYQFGLEMFRASFSEYDEGWAHVVP